MNPIFQAIMPVVLLSILIYIIAQLVARVLNKPDVVGYMNSELLGILIFLTILVTLVHVIDLIVYGSVSILNPTAKQDICDANGISIHRCHVTIAGYFLESILRELTDYYIQLNSLSLIVSFVKSLYGVKAIQGDKFVKLNFMGFVHIPESYIDPLIGLTQSMLQFGIAQFMILWYITSPQFFVGFLSLGLVLRLFAPTKSAGGLIIALVLGLYYVFPMAYVLIDVHYRNAYDGTYGFNKINTFRITDHLLSAFGLPFSSEIEGAINALREVQRSYDGSQSGTSNPDSAASSVAGSISYLSSLVALIMKISVIVSALFIPQLLSFIPGIITGYTLLADVSPQVFLGSVVRVPVILLNIYTEFFLIFAVLIYISLISTIAFIKTFSPILGGDVEIAGITRFI
ncbi:MAG: hypothetical protein NZ908_00350 [Candidatus Micrarchaeota archaeon]|nr:hypothetical protein [Candidatus Micrarchaeota archaeon]MCX8154637.1 hypothetical protein [Candidatus Micrarchaeota archaeon]